MHFKWKKLIVEIYSATLNFIIIDLDFLSSLDYKFSVLQEKNVLIDEKGKVSLIMRTSKE